MKAIKVKKLKEILKLYDDNEEYIFEDDMYKMYKEYGDDWFIEDGRWQLCSKNYKKIRRIANEI